MAMTSPMNRAPKVDTSASAQVAESQACLVYSERARSDRSGVATPSPQKRRACGKRRRRLARQGASRMKPSSAIQRSRRLVDGEAVDSAGDAHRAQQSHQQRALGVALADGVGRHRRGGQRVTAVAARGDPVADEVVDGADAVVRAQGSPAATRDQRLGVRLAQIEQRCRGQQGVLGVGQGAAPFRRAPAPGAARPAPAG
jgi:hypothetical protein